MSSQAQLIEVRVSPIKKSFGFLDHYYFVINGMEYHPGRYSLGNILPLNTTKNSFVVYKKMMCSDCFHNIIHNFNLSEDTRVVKYFPFINCESLSMGISCQSLGFLAIPFLLVGILRRSLIWVCYIMLLTCLYLMGIGRYMRLRTRYGSCRHLIDEKQDIYEMLKRETGKLEE